MPSVWLPELVIEELRRLANQYYPLEIGGMLMGYIAENKDYVVTSIIGPGPNAKHSRHAFEPDSDFQLKILHARYMETNGRETYLGDWHTHPDGTTNLSRRDKETLASIAATPESKITSPLMAVAAGSKEDWKLDVVRFISSQKKWFCSRYRVETLTHLIY